MTNSGLIPPTVADMGFVLWGPTWAHALSEALCVTLADIAAWETDPTRRPADLQEQLDNFCEVRMQEIDLLRTLMGEVGLGRADRAETDPAGEPEE